MIHRPLSAPNNGSLEPTLAQFEQVIFSDPSQAREIAKSLELVDFSGLNTELQIRYLSAMGFQHNVSDQLKLAEKCYMRALELMTQPHISLTRSQLLAHLAGVQMNLDRFDDGEKNLNLAVQAIYETSPAADLALIQCRRAFLMLHYARFDQAMSCFFEGIEALPNQIGNYSLAEAHIAAMAWSGLGEVYMRTSDQMNTREAYLNCLKICEQSGVKVRIGWHYLNAGTCMLNEGALEKAKDLFQKALLTADHRNVHASAQANMGIAHMREHQYQLAANFFDAAEKTYGAPAVPEDYSNLSVLEAHRADIALAQNDQVMAQKHLEKAFFEGIKGGNRQHLINVCRRLAKFHSLKNEYRQAYEYMLHAEEFNTQYAKQLREEKIRELQIKHDAIQKEKEAALAKLELSALQLRALRAQFNPHFIFNSLSGLANMISANRNEEASNLLIEFSQLLRMSLDLSNEEWIPLDKELEFVLLYVQMQKKLKYKGNLYTFIEVPKEIAARHFKIPSVVLQPFIENAIEHGLPVRGGGSISIKFALVEPKVLCCTIEDNGIGLIASRKLQEGNLTKHKSRGMQFTRERLQMLHKGEGSNFDAIKLYDLSEIGEGTGTRVVLHIPVKS